MSSVSKKTETGSRKRVKTPGPFKGVRMRIWGTWVSEIRRPLSKERIWLGSFDAPEKAARAYDAALYCLQGPKGKFNFPDDERPMVFHSNSISSAVIKAVAASFAAPKCTSPECKSSECVSARFSASPPPTIDPPEVPPSPTIDPSEVTPSPTMNPPEISSSSSMNPSESSQLSTTNPEEVVVKTEIKSEGCDFIFEAGLGDHDAFSSESFILDGMFTLDPDTIWAILEETKEFTESK